MKINDYFVGIGVLMLPIQAYAASPTFCSNPTMAYQAGCVRTCAAIAQRVSSGDWTFSMTNNSFAKCEGENIELNASVYKIELGRTEIGNERRCTIWEGGDMRVTLVGTNQTAINSDSDIDLRSCEKGVEYNAFYLTVGRSETFSATAPFPDGSGKVAKTIAATDTVDYSYTGNWYDGTSDNDGSAFTTDRSYVRTNVGVFKKFDGNSMLTNDYGSSTTSGEDIVWDEVKTSAWWATDTTTRPGFLCDPSNSNDCTGPISGDDSKYVTILPFDDDVIRGSKLVLDQDDETMILHWHRADQGTGVNQSEGVDFVWYWDGTTLSYAGASSSGNHAYYSIEAVGSRADLLGQ